MSELMVLGFENEAEADSFGLKLAQMQKDLIVQLEDAAEVVRDPDGKPHVKHGHGMVGAGAMGGAFFGMLFGLLFFIPFLGLAIGAGMGALFAKMGKTGIDQQVLQQMGDAVPPGKAGWFLLIGQMTEDKFLAEVQGTKRQGGAHQLDRGAGEAAQGGLRGPQAREVRPGGRRPSSPARATRANVRASRSGRGVRQRTVRASSTSRAVSGVVRQAAWASSGFVPGRVRTA